MNVYGILKADTIKMGSRERELWLRGAAEREDEEVSLTRAHRRGDFAFQRIYVCIYLAHPALDKVEGPDSVFLERKEEREFNLLA